MRKVVLIEFNELIPTLLDRWMSEGRLPNFKNFFEQSHAFVGVADMPERPNLAPWIQWYSMHTGLAFPQHKVVNLADGPKAGHIDIWRHLLEHGYRVGNCASMNAAAFKAPGSFYLPDPWCNTEAPDPPELAAYQRIVSSVVQENSHQEGPQIGRSDYLAFLRFVATHGLSSHSVSAITQQLLTEARSRKSRWRRAVLLDKLQFDVFQHYWTKNQPHFASFFTNSTAHFQHSFFHLLEPQKFDLPGEMLADNEHRDAILFGYQEMDRLLASFFRLERKHNLLLILSTALSQEPNPEASHLYYRPRSMERLCARVGIDRCILLPVMAHQFSLEFDSQAAADRARQALGAIAIDGKPVFRFGIAPARTLFLGCGLTCDVPKDAILTISATNQSLPFAEMFYRLPTMKTGAHHPDSVLWFKTGTHRKFTEKLPILNVLPTLADYFDVPMPTRDGLIRRGHSILGVLGLPRYREEMRRAA